MDVHPKTCFAIIDKLFSSIRAEFYTVEEKVQKKTLLDTKINLPTEGKGQIHPKINVFLHRFGYEPTYFQQLQTQAKKNRSPSFNNKCLIRVLEYIEKVPDNLKFSGTGEEDEAKKLVQKFEEKYLKNYFEAERMADFEQSFLQFVTTRLRDYKPTRIIDVVKKYLNALDTRSYIEAWGLLTPDFQKYSIWDGGLENFIHSFNYTVLARFYNIGSFKYGHRTVECSVEFYEGGFLHDIKGGIEKDAKKMEYPVNRMNTFIRQNAGNKRYIERISWIEKFKDIDLNTSGISSLDSDKLLSYDVQKFFAMCEGVNTNTYADGAYSAVYISDFKLYYWNDSWLIDNINVRYGLFDRMELIPVSLLDDYIFENDFEIHSQVNTKDETNNEND